ncbi:hypothetical protein Z959_04945 [Clostridium novyi B str. ATCC 27606]|uniref:DUF4397 domain-containing protein n=2 Tax=Clostridium TaxID=1485 RepID=A0AA40IVN2_CLONO|nr:MULTISPECIES: DUF4397 domain-containing protein [Clostridium]KEI13825.1 hypothetical protein Z958_02215 [Clostridium novyi B str. NCTC 9691]KEI16489.1 hypothetical protein Z960_09265 [Clostridium haemolyticum NCTC 9693]KEI18133.1 hypothetical protein Z959_04945 [Clostridium novyi B str. ATCC 27606]KGN04335.1 hypothetical protein Z961_03300 [Clostridium haemolyticum NCTC 8350]
MTLYPYWRIETKSFIRLLHASPNAPAVDVYFNNQIITPNLKYKDFTQYMSILPGIYNIKVFPAGKLSSPIIDTRIKIPSNKILTLVIGNTLNNILVLPYEEAKLPIPPNNAYVKFVHLSPDTPNLDITLTNDTILFKNVGFEKATKYIPLKTGDYTIHAKPTGTNKVILTVPNIILKPNRFYTLYIIGNLNGNPPLQMLIPLDGNSYINL